MNQLQGRGRIQVVADNGHEKTYKYDDAGERVIKRGPQGETAYINQFFTMRNREVGTKHVFAGPTRLVSKLVKMPRDANNDGIEDDIANCSAEPWGWTNGNGNGGTNGNAGGNGNGNGNNQCKTNNGNGGGNNTSADVYEKDQYFFHPDHLGSSSYVTDADGEIFQHLEYFPFGETFVEEHSNTQRTPYLFTAKELDEETGLYYFGARYYDPRTSVWQSPDPILASYMGGSPAGGVFAPRNLNLYGYAGQNPVRVQDPDGKFLDTILDVGFIIYDLGALAYDEVANGGANRTENLMALGADAAGALVPFATGGGVVVRAGSKVAAHADDAAHAAKMADKGTDAARVAEEGVTHIDEAVDAGKGATDVGGTTLSGGDAMGVTKSTSGGRSGKQARLRELANDDKLGSADRGWIKQEINSIERGNRRTIRNPPGKDLAHERGREAAKGYGYEHSNLQDRDLHRLQHKFDDFGRKNTERPLN